MLADSQTKETDGKRVGSIVTSEREKKREKENQKTDKKTEKRKK